MRSAAVAGWPMGLCLLGFEDGGQGLQWFDESNR